MNKAATTRTTYDNKESLEDPNFDRKLDLVTAGAQPYLKDHLLTRITRDNCVTIINYILAFQTEINLSERYRIDTIYRLKQLGEFHHHKSKPFKDMTRQDVVDFLDRLRKPESVDPLHKWIGTYEITRVVLLRFFKWVHYPDVSPSSKRPKPAVMDNIPKIKRKEISTYKPTDLWTEEDDAIFYKYCPSVRDKCWHAISRDTACRPHELLKLKVKDVVIQQLSENGAHIARITVNGKTGTRNVRLSNSYPRLKEWLSGATNDTTGATHPYHANPNAPLFCGLGKKSIGRKLGYQSINMMYARYKKVHFPKLLQDPLVPEEDKRKIRDLLKKPWNPYVRRHTAATEISKRLKDDLLTDQYMGWSHGGKTRMKYKHYYADDSFDAMLVADGLISPDGIGKKNNKDILKPKQCPNCDETNIPESKFCVKCKFVLSFDAFNETLEEREKTKQEKEQYKKRFEELEARLKQSELEGKTRQQQQIAEMNAKLDNTQDQVAALLQMLTSVNEEEAANTSSKKDFLLRKLGILTNGKIGEDPNNPSIVVEPPVQGEGVSSGPCLICGEKTSGMIKVETPTKHATAFKEGLLLSTKLSSSKKKLEE